MSYIDKFVVIVALFALATGTTQATSVYSNNFDSGSAGSAFSGSGTVTPVGGLDGHDGFSGDFLLNNAAGNPAPATVLTLSGLTPSSTLDLSFSLGLLGSWDGTDGTPSPDYFNVTLNGVSVLQTSTNTASGSPVVQPAGVTDQEGGTGACFYLCYYGDTTFLVNLSGLSFTGSTATIAFFASGAGWQGGTDEAWGIDNVSVSSSAGGSPVPEPATGLLLVGGLVALGLEKRRRR